MLSLSLAHCSVPDMIFYLFLAMHVLYAFRPLASLYKTVLFLNTLSQDSGECHPLSPLLGVQFLLSKLLQSGGEVKYIGFLSSIQLPQVQSLPPISTRSGL